MKIRTPLVVVALLACSAVALAQPPLKNPGHAEFTASEDHAAIDKYVLGYFVAGATAPLMEVDLAKPTPDAQQLVSVVISARPLGFGTYVARVKAVAGSLSSEWTEASNAFERVPFPPPGSPAVKK